MAAVSALERSLGLICPRLISSLHHEVWEVVMKRAAQRCVAALSRAPRTSHNLKSLILLKLMEGVYAKAKILIAYKL